MLHFVLLTQVGCSTGARQFDETSETAGCSTCPFCLSLPGRRILWRQDQVEARVELQCIDCVAGAAGAHEAREREPG